MSTSLNASERRDLQLEFPLHDLVREFLQVNGYALSLNVFLSESCPVFDSQPAITQVELARKLGVSNLVDTCGNNDAASNRGVSLLSSIAHYLVRTNNNVPLNKPTETSGFIMSDRQQLSDKKAYIQGNTTASEHTENQEQIDADIVDGLVDNTVFEVDKHNGDQVNVTRLLSPAAEKATSTYKGNSQTRVSGSSSTIENNKIDATASGGTSAPGTSTARSDANTSSNATTSSSSTTSARTVTTATSAVINKPEPSKIYKCPLPDCDKKYGTAAGLRYHMKTLHNTTPKRANGEEPKPAIYKCQINCGKAYSTLAGLRYHMKTAQHTGKSCIPSYCNPSSTRNTVTDMVSSNRSSSSSSSSTRENNNSHNNGATMTVRFLQTHPLPPQE